MAARTAGPKQRLLFFAAALALLGAASAYPYPTPTLGSGYVLNKETFVAYSWPNAAPASGTFAAYGFRCLTGDVWNSAAGSSGVVWDSRNNSVAYVLDRDGIRILDFSNPTSATAVTTLAVSPFITVPSSSMCGDTKQPQTLYVTGNSNGRNGKILAIRLGANGVSVTSTATYDVDLGPSNCVLDSTGRYLYTMDNSFRPVPAWATPYATVRVLDTQSTPATPTITEIAGGEYGECDFDGPALGAGFACWAQGRGLALDATNSYLYFIDGNHGYVRMLNIAAGNITRVAGKWYGGLNNALQSGIFHFAPAPALGSPVDQPSGLAWSPDRSVLYMSDVGYNTLPLRALTFSSPTSATMYDFSINHGTWSTCCNGYRYVQSDQMRSVTVNPSNGNVFALSFYLYSLGIPPPPPPSPPPVQAPATSACWNAAHRFRAAPAVAGLYADTGALGGWAGTAMGWLSPLPSQPARANNQWRPQDYNIDVLSGDYDAPLGVELYSAQWGVRPPRAARPARRR